MFVIIKLNKTWWNGRGWGSIVF